MIAATTATREPSPDDVEVLAGRATGGAAASRKPGAVIEPPTWVGSGTGRNGRLAHDLPSVENNSVCAGSGTTRNTSAGADSAVSGCLLGSYVKSSR